jgi:hypothetical protein
VSGPAKDTAVGAKLEQMPETHRRTYVRAMSGRSLRAAVNAFCAECVGWNRREIARCTALACPLYSYRPFKEV